MALDPSPKPSLDTSPLGLPARPSVRRFPEQLIVPWKRLSCGLWQVPKGDIWAAYCADTFPKLKVFTEGQTLFANCGAAYSGMIRAAVDGYPLIPPGEYGGPESVQFSYEGRTGFLGKAPFRLGPRVKFVASEPTVREWRTLFQAFYANGGVFASHPTYREFLKSLKPSDTGEWQEAFRAELDGPQSGWTKRAVLEALDGGSSDSSSGGAQLSLGF